MARGIGRSGSGRPALNELHPNGEPPQSTLAAQLVNKITDGRRRPMNQDEETFKQLLREVLDSENEVTSTATTIEANWNVNYKLIYVIVKAGLDVLTQDDPFIRRNVQITQAIDSLTAIQMTLRRTPTVLFFAPARSDDGSQRDVPLLLWLMPKLLALLSPNVHGEIREAAERLLRTSLMVERKAHMRGIKARTLLRYLQRLTEDLLSKIEGLALGRADNPISTWMIPSDETILALFQSCRMQSEQQKSVRTHIRDLAQAVGITLCLLKVLVEFMLKEREVRSAADHNTPCTDWVFRSLNRIWNCVSPDDGQYEHSFFPAQCLEAFLKITRCLYDYCTDHAANQPTTLPQFLMQITATITASAPLPSTMVVETALCFNLFEIASPSSPLSDLQDNLKEHIHPSLAEIVEDHIRFNALSADLQYTLSFILRLLEGQEPESDPVSGETSLPPLQDPELRQTYSRLFGGRIPNVISNVDERPQKRARLTAAKEDDKMLDICSDVVSRIYVHLGLDASIELNGLSQVAVYAMPSVIIKTHTNIDSDCYSRLREEDQCQLFQLLGQSACLFAYNQELRTDRTFSCRFCDAETTTTRSAAMWRDPEAEEIMRTFTSLIKLCRTPRSRQPRVAAMTALIRLLSHTPNTDHLKLGKSPVGQMCLTALHSSVRELRVAAGRALPVFLRQAVGCELALENRLLTLDYMRSLSDQGDVTVQETCILAWGQIARNVADGDELNLVLLKLVEYLGHTNPLLSGLAYDELQAIANHSPFTAMKMFAPYWRTVAVTVVQDLQRRPQIAQQVSDLLAMGVSDFLVLTQAYTIPFFVLRKRQDILQRIADASGQSIMTLCREHNNMAAILSNILLQTSTDAESLVMALLKSISPEFSKVDCAELLKSEPQATAAELLKFASDNDEMKRPKAHQALHLLAGVTHGKPLSSRGGRQSNVIGPFFESHVLGIMALLADSINDGRGPQPMLEKIRCLGAIREMIKIARSHVGNALPQICACLRSAIENRDLANQGFQAWIVMMSLLGEDDIAPLVDPTFALIVEFWGFFTPDVQKEAYDMVSLLLKSHASMIREIVHTLPSLKQVSLMAKFEEELGNLKAQMDVKHHFQAFCQRCQSENSTVIIRALRELTRYLEKHQSFLHGTANSEQPDPVLGQLTRVLLDTSVLFSSSDPDIAGLCARCLGMVGCLDPTRIEAAREKREILVLSNFTMDEEIRDFIIFFLREVLVKAFLSATNSRSQGFLAYAMQELLALGEFEASIRPKSRKFPFDANYRRWVTLPESIRTLLTPFLDSKYFVTAGISQPPCTYPLYKKDMGHAQWLRLFTFDLLQKDLGNGMIKTIFPVLSRIIRSQDIAIANFLLPFAALNIVVNGSHEEKKNVAQELLNVLAHPLSEQASQKDNTILCSQVCPVASTCILRLMLCQTVFEVLDYLSRWMQEKKKETAYIRSPGTRVSRVPSEAELERDAIHISSVEATLNLIPADIISRRAVECKSYARALFHWEQYIRQQRHPNFDVDGDIDLEPYYERLQDIYTQIDEPDGIEGISAHLQVLNIDQQILEHRKAGRWTAAQSWYELLLTERPNNLDVQYNLLTSLKESGQHDVLLNQIETFPHSAPSHALSLPFATEASWVTGKWEKLRSYVDQSPLWMRDFNVGIGRALLALSDRQVDKFAAILGNLRSFEVRSLSTTNTASLQECHESMLKFHVLAELEAISGAPDAGNVDKQNLTKSLNQRLDVLGPFLSDKQYILGLRRAAMQLSRREFSNLDIASAWLTSAKLARKGDFTHQAFNAVLHASQLGDASATIEHSRLLWREGNHRKAIQSLEGAIAANAFRSHDYTEADVSMTTNNQGRQQQQNLLKAKAHLLLAKWIDRAGQTQSDVIIHQYKKAVEFHNRWERGHYHLGKHYNKLLESEKGKSPPKQAQTFITGETAKLVVENYLRSLAFGAKYIYQTMPRILTLWLDLGTDAELPLDPKYGNDETFRSHIMTQRRKLLGACNAQIKKYIDRLPAFVFYTALPQIVARLCHPNQAVYNLLVDIVAKVVLQHAPQALWTLLAMVKSSSKDRANRGVSCMTRVLENARRARNESTSAELKALITQGQKLSDQLLRVCEGDIQGKPSNISLTKDLGFNHKTAASKLAMPIETCLTARLPTTDNIQMKQHEAFSSNDYVHISAFLDDVLVLNSLQRPRKISIRGSDGRVYALLCKPKDDLRKDQRLMEFNAMINRALKKDAESSKRRLYIKTYAVTPLNEECGLIEWIDNLKTLREILLNSYKQKGVHINYSEIRVLLNESVSAPDKLPIFTNKVLPHFPPVFHEWFVEMFPEPGAWFTARLRYTRSCAVMSIVGHVLGLGDRHGENVLFEEGNGGTFHVDFNCLFDKGLTFEKPELVPFRLTHNMVDAFGAYGYEGPFRKSCELTNNILRQHEDTLMTILETFLYDPTTDFIGKKKKRGTSVPDTPEGVLENVRNKVRGSLPGESVPLSVEGYVDELIKQATDQFKLASMYIGWCAFF
ncbi:MAG: hypothetical protein Q9217_001540 [Psora testacea]